MTRMCDTDCFFCGATGKWMRYRVFFPDLETDDGAVYSHVEKVCDYCATKKSLEKVEAKYYIPKKKGGEE